MSNLQDVPICSAEDIPLGQPLLQIEIDRGPTTKEGEVHMAITHSHRLVPLSPLDLTNDDGMALDGREEDHTVNFFKNSFHVDTGCSAPILPFGQFPLITTEDIDDITEPLTKEEVRAG
ncbi:hypothetical protein Ancab_012507 [Ancistrocladus abbreviatus]